MRDRCVRFLTEQSTEPTWCMLLVTSLALARRWVSGEITYDGHGNSLANFTLNLNGTIHTFAAVAGTYTINSDCTGTHLEGGSHYSFVVSPNGNNATWIETDTGAVITGTEVRLNPVEDFESEVRREDKGIAPANLRRSRKPSAILKVKAAAATR